MTPSQPTNARESGPPRWPWFVALSMSLVMACSVLVPPYEWDRSRGPVVPHDTFPADCSLCHDAESGSWHVLREDFSFDHEKETGVPLRGAHARAECLRCHNDRGPVGEFAARGCGGCHVDPHRGKLGPKCADCHDERAWRPREMIARHARTRFPLVGAHAAAACYRCHPGAQVGNFEGADTACTTCHAADLARATAPDHAAQGWTTDCQRCHVPLDWKPARFAHPASFPLTGAHGALDCATCHTSGSFGGLSPDCASCHLDDYQRTTNPNHVAGNFSTKCDTCHSTSTWKGARFEHPSSFPLTGGHGGLDCSRCHTAGGFGGLSTACASCHLDDYQRTTNPDHAASGFSTNCETCHGTTTWKGAVFNHRFPIDRGKHQGLSCTDCHKVAGNFSVFTCTDCHAHTKPKMDDKHKGVGGYVYASPSCLSCHPDGKE